MPACASDDTSSRTYTFMPPLSPAPGWASGDVWSERTASVRTKAQTLSGDGRFLDWRRRAGVLVLERLVDAHEGLLLILADVRVPPDLADEVRPAFALLEDAGPYVQGLGGDLEGTGDLLEDLGRRLPQPPLDLAQVRVRDPRHLRQLAQRQVPDPPLIT